MNAQAKIAPEAVEPLRRHEERLALRPAALAYVESFSVDNAHPFSCPVTSASEVVAQIRSLAMFCRSAFLDADLIDRGKSGDEEPANVSAAHPVHTSRVFEAIETLAALALLLEEVAR